MNDVLSKVRRKHQFYRCDVVHVVEAKKYIYIYVPYYVEIRVEKNVPRDIVEELINIAQRIVDYLAEKD